MCNLPSQSSNMNIISDLRKRANQNVLWGAREIRRFIDQAEKNENPERGALLWRNASPGMLSPKSCL